VLEINAMPDEKPLALPGSSWDAVKKIIRAFGAVQNEENPKVEDIAKLAGVPRPVVSMNNAFLRSISIVKPDQWKLTDIGRRYVTAVQMGNEIMAAESLSAAVRTNPVLTGLLNLTAARGEIKTSTFKAELVIKLGLDGSDKTIQFKPLLDMLQEARLIEISGDEIGLTSLRDYLAAGFEPEQSPPVHSLPLQSPPVQSPTVASAAGIPAVHQSQALPVLLGPNRIAYIQLPNDWDGKKDLKKLIKLLELSLGDEVSEVLS
jgi:hypothetical protein